ncbi:hypothetical protein KAR91_80185 [Candidatus Pacearchaeota archaeon]|nr:hypothetical protein [Candidatus Pacearchaeota archaeon]
MSWLFGTNLYEFISYDSKKGLMTIQKNTVPGMIERLLFDKKEEVKTLRFIGSSTVWHSLPNFVRQDTFTEIMLSEYWGRWKFEKKCEEANYG